MTDLTRARVIAGHRGWVTLHTETFTGMATITGRLRHESGSSDELPAVGDWVLADLETKLIHEVLPRTGAIRRTDREGGIQVIAANVDVAFIVTSCNRDVSARRLERFVALAVEGGAQPICVLNKTDLVDDPGPSLAIVREAVGAELPVVLCSALNGEGMDVLAEQLPAGKTGVLIGTSGVGKSTLTNAMLGEDVQETAPIRAVDDRGTHTTVRRELLALPWGASLIDTPGLKLPKLAPTEPATLELIFDDVEALAAQCKFANCLHGEEPGCAVAAAIADGTLDPGRLDAMRHLEREQRFEAEREDAAGLAARRARERSGTRAYKKVKGRTER